MFSTHGEADTIILLYSSRIIIVRSDYTDVLFIIIQYCSNGMFGN